MLVLSLCRKLCPHKIPVDIGLSLGDGADGEVCSIASDPVKVIKLSILYEQPNISPLNKYSQVQRVLDYLILERPLGYATVYDHGYLGTFSRKTEFGNQSFIIFYYIMEKLLKISDDERRVFHSILSHEDRGIKKNFSSQKIQEMLEGMSRALDFDLKKITLFYNKIKSPPVFHLDIHVRNIMKDEFGNFKMIDLDRIELESLDVKK